MLPSNLSRCHYIAQQYLSLFFIRSSAHSLTVSPRYFRPPIYLQYMLHCDIVAPGWPASNLISGAHRCSSASISQIIISDDRSFMVPSCITIGSAMGLRPLKYPSIPNYTSLAPVTLPDTMCLSQRSWPLRAVSVFLQRRSGLQSIPPSALQHLTFFELQVGVAPVSFQFLRFCIISSRSFPSVTPFGSMSSSHTFLILSGEFDCTKCGLYRCYSRSS